jgi:hypothetical protein
MATTTEQSTPEQATPTKPKATPKPKSTPKSESTPKATATKPKAAPKPNLVFGESQVVYANHPRSHPAEGQAKVLRDFYLGSTYVSLQWLDENSTELVHRNRVTAEPKPEPEPKSDN